MISVGHGLKDTVRNHGNAVRGSGDTVQNIEKLSKVHGILFKIGKYCPFSAEYYPKYRDTVQSLWEVVQSKEIQFKIRGLLSRIWNYCPMFGDTVQNMKILSKVR